MGDCITSRHGWGPLEIRGEGDSIDGPADRRELSGELLALFDKMPSVQTVVIIYQNPGGWDVYDRTTVR